MLKKYPKKFYKWFKIQPIHKKLFVLYSILSLMYVPFGWIRFFASAYEYVNFSSLLMYLPYSLIGYILRYFVQLIFAAIIIGTIQGGYDALKVAVKK